MRLVALAVVLWPLTGCLGSIGDAVDPVVPTPPRPTTPVTPSDPRDPTDPTDPVDPTDPTPVDPCVGVRTLGETPLRRLSSAQYANTLDALFGPAVGAQLRARSVFPATEIVAGFHNDADANTVSTGESNAIEDTAEAMAGWLLDNAAVQLPAILGCSTLGGASDVEIDGCMDGFIERFGARVYRRPLDPGERARVRALYDLVRATQDARKAWAAVMQLFLQAPAFLYRVERGAASLPGLPEMVALTDYEMASRLSYFFLDTMPDDALLAKAAAQELHTPEQIEIEARRLLSDPRVMATMGLFHRDWLRTYKLTDAPKVPALDDGTRASLLAETTELVRAVMEQGDGSLRALLSTADVPVNADTAPLYGLPAAGRSREAWTVETIADRRGLLTSAAFMATHARDASTHPIERGAFVRREVLCGSLPPLPGNIDINGPLEATASLPTARERLAPLLERNDCKGCHININPIGFAFENYDQLGRWRDLENGVRIDPAGELASAGDADGAFSTPQQLAERLADSQVVAECYATQWFRFAVGKRETPEDACVVAGVKNGFVATGGNIEELLVQITKSDAFMYRRKQEN